MFRSLKDAMRPKDSIKLGDKTVRIEKLTPKKWRELFRVIDIIPSLFVQVAQAPKDEVMAYVLSAIDVGLDEMVRVTGVLTGIDESYIEEYVGLDEMIEYLTRMVEHNNLERTVKNVKSLLPKVREEKKGG